MAPIKNQGQATRPLPPSARTPVPASRECVIHRVSVVHEHDEGVALRLIGRRENAHPPAEQVLKVERQLPQAQEVEQRIDDPWNDTQRGQ